MVTEVVMTVWIRLVLGSEKVKDHDVDEARINNWSVVIQHLAGCWYMTFGRCHFGTTVSALDIWALAISAPSR